MSQAGTVAWLAVRELWMTFRLLLVLFGWVAAGSLVGIVPGTPGQTLERLAIGTALATAVGAGVAAWTLADERQAGRAAWLVTRSVPRGTYLVGWFAAMTVVALAGLLVAGLLAWLAVGGAAGAVDAPGLAASLVAVAATSAAAIALGLLAGAILRGVPAVAVTLAAAAALAAVAALAPDALAGLPGTAHLLVARAAGPDPVLADALRAAGIGLALAAILLAVARVALERTEL